MNYYEHHIGDFDQATAHLTACEDGIYSRLIRRYYATEKPLPTDIAAVQRLVRARSKEEKQAVDAMLHEFFTLEADGWHQHRCDEDIVRYCEKQGKARASANARWAKPQSDGNADAMRTHSLRISDADAMHGVRICDGDAPRARSRHQTPDTSPQTPITTPVLDLRSQTSGEQPLPVESSTPTGRKKRLNGQVPPTSAVWQAYAVAYAQRYGTEPVRNASVNGQLAQFVSRIPHAEAPEVAAFYVRHNAVFYVRARHPVSLLLRDAEGMRTQWATGRVSTGLEARSAEQVDAVREQIERVGRELGR